MPLPSLPFTKNPLPSSALLPDVYTAPNQLLRERWEQGFNKQGSLLKGGYFNNAKKRKNTIG